MKLSEIKDEQALDVLADLIEPLAEMAADKEVQKAVKAGCTKAALIKMIIKSHKSQVLEIMARLDGKEPADYHCNLFTLPVKLLEILNDPNILTLFGLQGQTGDATSSGSASESTVEN